MRASLLFNALAAFAVLAVLLFGSSNSRASFRLVGASGALTLSNSRAGAAILSGERLRPGSRATGSVTLGNPGGTDAALALEVASEGGTGGERLLNRLRLAIADSSRVVYDGPLAGGGRLSLGTLAAGARRTYTMTATLPRGANDNALQGARLSVRFTWLTQAEATPAPPAPTPTAPPAIPAPPASAPAPVPAPEPSLSARQLISLPSAKRCVRSVRIQLKARRGVKIKQFVAAVNGRKRATVKGTKRAITLHRLPAGRLRVKVTATLSTGRKLTRTRTYRACAAR